MLISFVQGAIILCGLGFNGYDPVTGRTRWNRCRNVDVLRLETAENYKVLFDNWNMRTSSESRLSFDRVLSPLIALPVWLRECVYKRVTPKGKKPGFQSTMITFCASAFWVSCAWGSFNLALLTAFFPSLSTAPSQATTVRHPPVCDEPRSRAYCLVA